MSPRSVQRAWGIFVLPFPLTRVCSAFSRAVSTLTLSLPLLMHNADAVVALVLEWCPKADAFSRAALVALLPQLARDLQDAFYPYFAPVFSMLVALLDPGQAEALQVLFTCLDF